jgi:hypothetical protein
VRRAARVPRRGQKLKRCTRFVTVANTIRFTLRLGRHTLSRGSYRLQVVAAINGLSSKTATVSFKIVR